MNFEEWIEWMEKEFEEMMEELEIWHWEMIKEMNDENG